MSVLHRGFILEGKIVNGYCDNNDCTVGETGTCLINHENPLDCPHFHAHEKEDAHEIVEKISASDSDQFIPSPPIRQFHSGNELGTRDASEIMASCYGYIIGILGAYDAGKTCFICSLYLLAACGELMPGYYFAGSLTLQGFENRARHLRKWGSNAKLPDKLVEHTILAHPRNPALMHLALQEKGDLMRRLDLLLTDLPGEWTSTLIDRGSGLDSRFDFLKRADGIIYVIDSQLLADDKTRHKETHRAKLFLDRLRQYEVDDKNLPVVLLLSKCDELHMATPSDIDRISEHANKIGLNSTVISCVSFSKKPQEIRSGVGVIEAIDYIVNSPAGFAKPNVSRIQPAEDRSFWGFRLTNTE